MQVNLTCPLGKHRLQKFDATNRDLAIASTFNFTAVQWTIKAYVRRLNRTIAALFTVTKVIVKYLTDPVVLKVIILRG